MILAFGVARVVRWWFLAMETWVQSRLVVSHEIHDGQSGTGAGFSLSSSGLPLLIIIPLLLYARLSPFHRVCKSPNHLTIIMFSVFKLDISSLIQHLTVRRVKRLLSLL